MRIAIIPARGGSKRIPGKNIRDFLGKPMLHWAIEAARNSDLFEHIVVSTDSTEIAEEAVRAGADVPFMRPAALAHNHRLSTCKYGTPPRCPKPRSCLLRTINVCVGFDADRANNIWVRVESSTVESVLAKAGKSLASVTKYYAAAVTGDKTADGKLQVDEKGRITGRKLDDAAGAGGSLGDFSTRDAAIDEARAHATAIGVP